MGENDRYCLTRKIIPIYQGFEFMKIIGRTPSFKTEGLRYSWGSKKNSTLEMVNVSPTLIKECVYCNDGFMLRLSIQDYDLISSRLYIDSSKRSLNFVLMQNTNVSASIPIGHSTTPKETV